MPEPFCPSFLKAETRAERFLPAIFRNAHSRGEHTRRASQRTLAPGMLEILRDQNEPLPAGDARKANLLKLSRPGTAVVVTGQQVGLFLGPLYTFYKTASAIATARALERESGVPCVPLFWVQTEDHDFPEINHCHFPNAEGGAVRLAIGENASGPPATARISVKHRILGDDVAQQLECLEQQLGSFPGASDFLGLLRRHYQSGRPMSEAFVFTLATLFSDEGLLFLDPRAEAVARLAAPLHRKAIFEADSIAARLLDRSRQLAESDFDTQVHVRSGSPLSFFHYPQPDGPRFRLEKDGGRWSLVGQEQFVSAEELRNALEEQPMRFSCSALLRPLLQDTLLPTAAYVAGPAEINYFAQLEPLYPQFNLPVPMIVPRARFRCLEPRVRSLLQKLRLAPAQVERPREALLESAVREGSGDYPPPNVVEEQLTGSFVRRLEELDGLMSSLDPALSKATQRTRESVVHAISRFVHRYQSALLEKNQVISERVSRVQESLYPSGAPQERVLSLPYFACRYGVDEFKRKIFEALVPFSADVVDVDL